MHHAEDIGLLQGFKVARNAPSVSHLLFADDSLLFFHVKQQDCDVVVDMLKRYKECLGQLINFDKSGIWFSSSTSHDAKASLINALDIRKLLLQIPTLTFSLCSTEEEVMV